MPVTSQHAYTRAPRAYVRALVVAAIFVSVLLAFPTSARAAMSIDSGPRVAVSRGQVTIWWYSSSTGSSELRWGTSAEAWANLPNDISNTSTTLGTLHSRTISNLAAGTYYFRARTVGAAGTATSSARRVVVTPPDASTPMASLSFNSSVYSTAVSADNATLYVGGVFTAVGTRHGAGFGLDTTSGTAGAGIPQISGVTNVSIPDGAGGFYIGGYFTRVGALERQRIAHLLPDGGIDPRFDVSADAAVTSLALVGTTLYVGGNFTTLDGQPRASIGAINTTTGDVTTWAPDANAAPTTMLVSGTTLYVGGSFTTIAGQTRNRLASFDTTTGSLSSWNPNIGGLVRALAIDGTTLYVGGAFTTVNGATGRNRIAALDTTVAAGTASAWNPNANADVYALVVSGTTVYTGGTFTNIGGSAKNYAAALSNSTGLAAAWNPNLNNAVTSLALNGTTMYLGGSFTTANGGTSRPRVAAVDTTAGTVTAWNPKLNNTVLGLAFSGTTVFVTGYATSYNVTTRNGAAAIDVASGTLKAWDPNVGGVANATVWTMVVSGSTVYLGGAFTQVNGGTPRNMVAAVDGTTGTATTFNPNVSATVYTMALSGTTLYIGGQFGTVNGGTVRNCAAALDTTVAAGTATAWNPNLNNSVISLAVSGGNVYLGGWFTTTNAGATTRNHLASFALGTSTPTAWNPNVTGGNIYTLTPGAGSSIFIGGDFTTVGATARSRLAEVDTTTGLATAFNPAPNGEVDSIARIGSTLYIGGLFGTMGGQNRQYFAAVTTSGTTTELDIGSTYIVWSATAVGTRVYIGGQFGSVSNSEFTNLGLVWIDTGQRANLADAGTLTFTQAPQRNIAPYQTTVWWQTSASSSSELVWDTVSHAAWTDYANDASNSATNLGTVHSRTISNLGAGTYYYRVRSRDASGNQVTSAEYSFTVTAPDAATPLGSTVFNGAVNSMAPSDDGSTLYVGGTFDRVGTRSGTTLTVNATTGTTLGGLPQVVGATYAVVDDGQGGQFIAGGFTSVGGLTRTRIAHILPDGGVDPTWTSSADSIVFTLLRSGTTLYVGGQFSTLGGQSRSSIGAIDTTTGAATAWNPGANNSVQQMALSGTTMFVVGGFTTIGGQARTGVAALDTTVNTNSATAWYPGALNLGGSSVAVGGGVVYVGGDFTTVNGTARTRIAAIDQSTGALLPWNPTNTATTVAALTLSGTTLYVGGRFSVLGGSARTNIGALSTSTALATTWNPGANGQVNSIALQGTDAVVGGNFTTIASVARSGAALLDTTVAAGTARAWTANVNDEVKQVSVISGTTIGLVGTFRGSNASVRMKVAAIDATSGELLNWNPGVTSLSGFVRSIAQRNGIVYIGGNYSVIGGQTRNRLSAVDATTGVPTAWDPNISSGSVQSLAINAAGTTIYAAGGFNTVNGATTRNNIAAFSTSTGTATAWDPNASSAIDAIVLSGTTIYAGGAFTTIGGQTRNKLAALDTTVNTGNATAWDPNVTGSVNSLALAGTTLYLGGVFTAVNGATARTNIAAVSTTTGTATAWNPGANNQVRQMAMLGSTLYVGGPFTTAGGQSRRGLAAIDTGTGTATSWNPDLGTNNSSEYGLFVNGTQLFVGGMYQDANTNTISQSGLQLFDVCDRSTYCSGENLRDYVAVSVGAPTVTMSGVVGNVSATGTTAVTVESNAVSGYTLMATDTSDTSAMTCTVGGCTGQSIADWTGTGSTPTAWATTDTGSEYGFGMTVLTTTNGTKDAKWGTGSGVADFVNNRYAGLTATSPTTIHSIDKFLGTAADVTTVGWRLRVSTSQYAGSYDGSVTFTVVANP